MVEQLTFNQWVTGSNPVALTILYGSKPLKALAFGGLFFLRAKRVPTYQEPVRDFTLNSTENMTNLITLPLKAF